jgi:hypothetical protein
MSNVNNMQMLAKQFCAKNELIQMVFCLIHSYGYQMAITQLNLPQKLHLMPHNLQRTICKLIKTCNMSGFPVL